MQGPCVRKSMVRALLLIRVPGPILTRPIGEVYVLNDGGEVDLDLGNYERYMDVTLSRDHNITTGKIYNEVIQKEVCWLLGSLQNRAEEFCSGVEIISGRLYK